ncbi:MAG: hypothetical protein ACYCSF_08660 [Acidimicrobiales bacterium]
MRRWLGAIMSLLLLVELLALGVRGTYASYNSETNNPGNSIASGTLSLSTTTSSTTCESWGGSVGTPSANVNPNCGTLAVTGGPFYPGQSTTVSVQVRNAGSLAAGDLSMFAATPCSPSPGICDAVEFYVEETNSAGTPIACYYPVASSGACSFDSFSSPGAPGTLTDFTNVEYYDSADRLLLTGGLAATTTRYFVLGFKLPTFTSASVGNQYQATTATTDLTWYLDQGGP